MWRKDEKDETDEAAPAEKTGAQRQRGTAAPESGAASSGPATIGSSISIEGDVTGEEDLLIQGRVDGLVNLENQAVTVGSEGRVNADISGRVVIVEGRVEGDLTASEQVILRSAARVEGDITAPRVVLEDGASFKGLVDMSKPSAEDETIGRGSTAGAGKATGPSSTTKSKKSGPSESGPQKSESGESDQRSSDQSRSEKETSGKTERATS